MCDFLPEFFRKAHKNPKNLVAIEGSADHHPYSIRLTFVVFPPPNPVFFVWSTS
jgi:hypothetical protein